MENSAVMPAEGGVLKEAVLKPGTYADFNHELSFGAERQRLEFRILSTPGSKEV